MGSQKIVHGIGIDFIHPLINLIGILDLGNVFGRSQHILAGEHSGHRLQRKGVLLDGQRAMDGAGCGCCAAALDWWKERKHPIVSLPAPQFPLHNQSDWLFQRKVSFSSYISLEQQLYLLYHISLISSIKTKVYSSYLEHHFNFIIFICIY